MSKIEDSLPWVEKYRPETLDDVLSHEEIINTIKRLIDQDRLPHLLFYGPPGTGKTSTILACAKHLYQKSWKAMTLELNASDDRGIDVVREKIKDFASTKMIFNKGAKLIILDEADSMTSAAQAALRRVIEKYTKNTRFCIICNYVSKISPALQSRCTRFRFSPLKLDRIGQMVDRVVEAEKLNITSDGREAIITLSNGDMRMCLNILQSTSMANEKVTGETVYSCTGNPLPRDIENIFSWLLESDFQTVFQQITSLQQQKGLALLDILNDLHKYLMRVVFKTDVKCYLLEQFASLEFRLSTGTSEAVQLTSLIGIFQVAREKNSSSVPSHSSSSSSSSTGKT